jgi:hypothetical protein
VAFDYFNLMVARLRSRTSVEDKNLQKDVQLTEEELDLIHRLAKSENPDADYDRVYSVSLLSRQTEHFG